MYQTSKLGLDSDGSTELVGGLLDSTYVYVCSM